MALTNEMALIQKQDHFVIKCKITPGSSKNKILGLHDGGLKIAIQTPAEKGKANQTLIKFLQKSFELKNNQVQILSGETSTLKSIAFYGITKDKWEAVLCKSLT